MVTIRVLDVVPRTFNNDDGREVHDAIREALAREEVVTLSFDGVDSVPSSFVNSALITLLHDLSFDEVRRRLRFVQTNSQINEMIRSRFNQEVERRDRGPVPVH